MPSRRERFFSGGFQEFTKPGDMFGIQAKGIISDG
jgi:hypothetical protein